MEADDHRGWITLEAIAALSLLAIALAGSVMQYRRNGEIIRRNREALRQTAELPPPGVK